jgi:AAA+ ATPase superfamily predicted ATPase
MMEKATLSYESPLYGRRTGQWKVDKLNPKYLKDFFPKYSLEEIIITFGVLDTIPGYLVKFDSNKDVYWNIKNKVLSKGEFLYSEGEFLLHEELRDPSNYLSILKSIAAGATKFSDIVNYTNLDKSLVSKYLYTLENLGFIVKDFPFGITYKSRLKGKGIYLLSDNYLRFWLRYVYNYYDLLEIGEVDKVFNMIDFKDGFVFEEFCRRILKSKLGTVYRWWHKDKEIDIVSYDDSKLIFGECKWKDKINPKQICKELIEKIQYVDVPNNLKNNKIRLWIFAKSFKEKITEFENYEVKCIDLKDLEKIFI